jgi:hypothetical protein
MAERKKIVACWSRFRRILKSGAVAEKGQIACIDTADGALVATSVATTLVPIGYFTDSFTGDGVKVMEVQLFAEITVQKLPASGTGAPVDADVGKVVYVHAASAVSTTSTGASVAGRLWGVDSADGLCWVQMILNGGAAS